MKIYSRYDVPKLPGMLFTMPTLTQQHLANECDINMIIERAIRTGDKTVFTTTQRAEYYDASAFTDYQSSVQYLEDIKDDFSSLPSSTRKQFGHDPAKYVEFMSNPSNYAKAVELGLLEGGEKSAAKPSVSAPSNPSGDIPQTTPEVVGTVSS